MFLYFITFSGLFLFQELSAVPWAKMVGLQLGWEQPSPAAFSPSGSVPEFPVWMCVRESITCPVAMPAAGDGVRQPSSDPAAALRAGPHTAALHPCGSAGGPGAESAGAARAPGRTAVSAHTAGGWRINCARGGALKGKVTRKTLDFSALLKKNMFDVVSECLFDTSLAVLRTIQMTYESLNGFLWTTA